MQYMNDLKGRRLGRMKVEFIEDGDEDEDFNANFDNEGRDKLRGGCGGLGVKAEKMVMIANANWA